MQNTKVTMLANTAVPTTTYVATSINIRYGMGLERGAYIVYSYPLTDTFRPPQTCTPPEAVIRTNVACKEYKDSGEIKAYTSTGQLVPGIQNTTVQTYINMFAQIGNSVVLIQAADTDAATLYTMLANFKEVSPLELPKDSSITFVPPTIPAYMPVAKPETTTPTSTPSTNQSDLDPETEQRLNQELMDSIR